MKEIPIKASGMTIMNGGVSLGIADATLNQLPTPTICAVQWDQCYIYADPSLEGVTLSVSYFGGGNIFISSGRIFTKNTGATITQTLDTVVASASQFVFMNAYSASVTYLKYNVVSYQGASYSCTATSSLGNLPTSTSFFTKIAGTIFRNTYNSGTTYAISDYVLNATGDALYVSIVDGNVGQSLTDTTKWLPTISFLTVTSAESARSTAESGRASSETTRVNQENTRLSSEITRGNSETTRNTQESTRQSQEATRVSQESARVTKNAAITFLGAYNNATSYVVGNQVNVSGTTYTCTSPTVGNIPPNASFWGVFAASGSVTSVTSPNSDISVATGTTTPVITANTGQGASQLAKRDANGNIPNNGNQIIPISANTTLTPAQSGIVNVTTSTSVITITLPTSVGNAQLIYTIKKVDFSTGTILINTTSSQTIDGLLTRTLLTQNNYIQVVSDGSNWIITDISNPAPYDNSITITHNLNLFPDVLPIKTYSAFGNGGGFGTSPFGGGSLFKLINTVEYYDVNSLKVYLSDSFSGTPTVIQNSTTEYLVNFSTDQNSLTLLLK